MSCLKNSQLQEIQFITNLSIIKIQEFFLRKKTQELSGGCSYDFINTLAKLRN